MALKNLFDMVKADRYTADGREALIKAQEAETEDKVYQIGEISQKTGLQKTAQGWRPVKKGAAGKTSRANKEEAIRKDLGLTAGEDMSRFSDEQIEKMYAKTQQTPEQQKADFDKSKIGQAVNKGRQEFAAEKTRQKELASKTNAIGLPKEIKPALSQTDGKGNKVEIKITESKGGGFYVDKYVNGKKVGINNANTRESAEAKAKSMMEQHMADPDYRAEAELDTAKEIAEHKEAAQYYKRKARSFSETDPSYSTYMKKAEEYENKAKELEGSQPAAEKSEGRNFRSELEANPKGAYDFEKTIEHSIPMTAGDKEILGRVKSFMQEEGTDYKNALKAVATGLVNGNRLRGNWYPEKEQSLLKIAKAVGMDDEVKSYVKTLAKGYDFGYSEDAAPRVLTGDCRIRIRKEKPALTGDTKIRVRK